MEQCEGVPYSLHERERAVTTLAKHWRRVPSKRAAITSESIKLGMTADAAVLGASGAEVDQGRRPIVAGHVVVLKIRRQRPKPDHLQSPLRALDVEGLHQRRARAALRGGGPQHHSPRVGRDLDRFGDIVARLAGMLERFCTTLDCVDVGFIPDGILDQLPQPSVIGITRVGGIDLDKPRIRRTLAAIVALVAAPDGFTVADLVGKVHALAGHGDYTVSQAAYDLRKLRVHGLVIKPERRRRYIVPPNAARTITAPLVVRDQVIASILAGVRSPRPGRKPACWTAIDRDYEALRIDMHPLFADLALSTKAA